MSVLVTGATGFIAQHVVDKLLSHNFTVIGTARSEAKYAPLLKEFQKKYPDGKLSFEIVPDISTDDAFDEVLKAHPEITKVLHTASPFSFGLNKSFEEAYLHPAVNGTLNILKATKKYAPQVTHFVVTSSFAAVRLPAEVVFTEVHTADTWNPIEWKDVTNENLAYVASKKLAEKAARDFVKNEKPNFSLSTVNPPFVLGPQLFDYTVSETLNTSNQYLLDIPRLKSKDSPVAQLNMLAVDVRDVAEFHVIPLLKEANRNQRNLVVGDLFQAPVVNKIVKKHFPQYADKVLDLGEAPKEHVQYDLSAVVDPIGGYDFIDLEKSVVDTLTQYFKHYPL
ncbi:hypothetical protein OGAPHI_003156 [Ogataea philodendri]|uniref:NAD-dependent epimerase/dehydratase domain-containing protein n=1 Tax=Ogataea philodendri TaxID=1378263 RepID=A0A9P8P902_9ASCO|nr:uncharacterized protein OGAPHI_003156 [Ogataea philodendri]KAH3667507.1 hypothetical protein OGAPHI_003156 [Ogataea philodendri]